YFVSTVLQFQIYRALCERTGQFIPGDPQRPLHKCDIYRNPQAGQMLTTLVSDPAGDGGRSQAERRSSPGLLQAVGRLAEERKPEDWGIPGMEL
ncbi:Uncharacterized protein OBRU01_03105, partial [Operophtera brumata]